MRELLQTQSAWFRSGATREIDNRVDALKRLRAALERHESELLRALGADLGKTPEESYLTELGPVYTEIRCMLHSVRRWSRTSVRPLFGPLSFARSLLSRDPYGVVLVVAGWTRPLLLCLIPLVDAIAAGNCVTVCPSLRVPRTARAIDIVLRESFRSDHAAITQGGRDAFAELVSYSFDKVFFSGTPEDGRRILRAAAETLTPVTLELDGKNPAVVMADADIRLAARRIVYAKMLNAGQTCDAPDYVLAAKSVETQLLSALRAEIVEQFGRRPLESRDLPRVASEDHFERLTGLLQGQNVFCGGGWNASALKLEPTIVSRPKMDSPLMAEPIYGPILSVLPYGAMQEAVQMMRTLPAPYALYCFTTDIRAGRRLMRDLPFGVGCLNDCGMQALSPALPSGGVGESGMGSYRGREGFLCFSRPKGIYLASNLDAELRYAPRRGNLSALRRALR